jgi:hypothetical protein
VLYQLSYLGLNVRRSLALATFASAA